MTRGGCGDAQSVQQDALFSPLYLCNAVVKLTEVTFSYAIPSETRNDNSMYVYIIYIYVYVSSDKYFRLSISNSEFRIQKWEIKQY